MQLSHLDWLLQRKRLKKSSTLPAATKQRQQAHSRNKLMDWDVASLEVCVRVGLGGWVGGGGGWFGYWCRCWCPVRR